MFFKWILFFMTVDISLGKFIRAMEGDEYDIIKDLVLNDGRFRLPPCNRTRKQKKCIRKILETKIKFVSGRKWVTIISRKKSSQEIRNQGMCFKDF